MERNLFIFNFKKMPRGFAWAVSIFIILEIMARLLWNPSFFGSRQYYEPNYDYGYSEQVPLFYIQGDKMIFFRTDYRTVFQQQKKKNKRKQGFRIFTLGTSVSQGREKENYSYFLEGLLNTKEPNTEWQVVDLSSGGYGSTRMALLFEQVVMCDPDLLILHIHGSNEYEDEVAIRLRDRSNAKLNKMLFRSHFIVILKKLIVRMGVGTTVSADMPNEGDASSDKNNLKRWNVTIERNVSRIVQLSKSLGIPVVLVGRVERNSNHDGFESERVISVNNVIQKYSEKKRVYYLDTPQIFYKHHPKREDKNLLFRDHAHWLGLGHRLIAEELAGLILKVSQISTR